MGKTNTILIEIGRDAYYYEKSLIWVLMLGVPVMQHLGVYEGRQVSAWVLCLSAELWCFDQRLQGCPWLHEEKMVRKVTNSRERVTCGVGPPHPC